MALKVGGTTVVDDSRNIQNIAGGLKTVNGSSILGSGNIEVYSTDAGAVGTYIIGRPDNLNGYSIGDTASGLYSTAPSANASWQKRNWTGGWGNVSTATAQSGTWRCMVDCAAGSSGSYLDAGVGLWVRIS